MGILQARTVEWVAIPAPADLPNPGIEPRSPALQVDSLPAEPQVQSKWVVSNPTDFQTVISYLDTAITSLLVFLSCVWPLLIHFLPCLDNRFLAQKRQHM